MAILETLASQARNLCIALFKKSTIIRLLTAKNDPLLMFEPSKLTSRIHGTHHALPHAQLPGRLHLYDDFHRQPNLLRHQRGDESAAIGAGRNDLRNFGFPL